MRITSFLMLLFVLTLFTGCKHQQRDLVNSVIGNESFVEKFGFEPDETTDANLRIKTHLEYVEHILRNKDMRHLSATHKERRLQLLDLLHYYSDAGQYPKNYEYSGERKSCFIDRDRNICAVGYLVEQTSGRGAAESINSKYQYASIFEMDSELVKDWIASSGLTRLECAMIQPSYQYDPVDPQYPNRVRPLYAVGSAVMMGANATFNVINVIDLARGGSSKIAPVLGLLAGPSQIAMGASGFARERKLTRYNSDLMLTSQGKLSLSNIGMGTATMLLSGWNLWKQKKAAEKRTSWNIFTFPEGNNQNGVGLSFNRKF